LFSPPDKEERPYKNREPPDAVWGHRGQGDVDQGKLLDGMASFFAQYRDLQDLAGPRLRLREYKYPTRAATAGVLSQETEFANFVKKGAAVYNLIGKEITSAKSKEQAKSRMKKDYKEIEKSVDKLCLQQSSL
jgi:hypothetical protein